MHNFAIAIHGGAENISNQITQNIHAYEAALRDALRLAVIVLQKGGTAVEAVEAAVNSMEDHPLFNAGRGSMLNSEAEVEMDASIMDGANLSSGAVSVIRQIKNPVSLAKAVMERSQHACLGGDGALKFAQEMGFPLLPPSYFITERQYDSYTRAKGKEGKTPTSHDTVGAVALDSFGNLAAATSTGGLSHKLVGRIGDSAMIGAGCYASNQTCAVSGTGDGEYLIRRVVAFDVAALVAYKGLSIQEACDRVVKKNEGEVGLICMDPHGNIAMSFNTDCMFRGWWQDGEIVVKIIK